MWMAGKGTMLAAADVVVAGIGAAAATTGTGVGAGFEEATGGCGETFGVWLVLMGVARDGDGGSGDAAGDGDVACSRSLESLLAKGVKIPENFATI